MLRFCSEIEGMSHQKGREGTVNFTPDSQEQAWNCQPGESDRGKGRRWGGQPLSRAQVLWAPPTCRGQGSGVVQEQRTQSSARGLRRGRHPQRGQVGLMENAGRE